MTETSTAPGSAATTNVQEPDPRTNAYSGEVADAALEGVVESRRFVRPVPHRLVEGISEMMRKEPDGNSICVSELLAGQRFDVVDEADGWAWGYSAHDHYVGYVRSEHLRTDAPTRTHWITTTLALGFSRPDIKSDVTMNLPMTAEIAAETFDENFLRHRNGTFVHRRHAAPIGEFASDHVQVAKYFLGTPYRWGGRRRTGIDCSGLVQVALARIGIDAPRDSDMQERELGQNATGDTLRRGDLVFFPGHVGIMADETNLLHANAHWMTTLIEPLDDVCARLDGPRSITSVRRL